jgi:hypothetical protein
MASLCTLHDGSTLKQMSGRDLSSLPIWSGNRVIDEDHVHKISSTLRSIKQLDHKPYHIVTSKTDMGDTVTQIVDGQHRATILKKYYTNQCANPFDMEEFNVLVIEKYVTCEEEIIDYFKMLNQTKAIQWREDPKMIVNRYIDALLKRFNTPKKYLIRSGKTRFPYICVETLREEALRRRIGIEFDETPDVFAERIYTDHCLQLYRLKSLGTTTKEEETALKAEFLLGLSKKMNWLDPSHKM